MNKTREEDTEIYYKFKLESPYNIPEHKEN
jgi:hypothetical protein